MKIIKLQKYFMTERKTPINQKNEQQKVKLKEDLQPNNSFIVLKLIQPARELLQSNNRLNCVFRYQLNPLPQIFKYSQQLHPLADMSSQFQLNNDLDLTVNIYRRDLTLKINPFETKNYFKTSGSIQKKNKIELNQIKFEKDQLCFDSHFESGNLLSVDKEIMSHKYHLMMQNDINTYGCTQWFFFRVYNKNPLKATFFIDNFYKAQSLYKKGMKILIFSMKKSINEQVGWVRGGQQLVYYQNKLTQKKQKTGQIKKFYTLKFSYNFEYQGDEVYFAYHYPYTYTRLNFYLSSKQTNKKQYYGCRTLCKTAAENSISLITITDPYIPKTKKKSIFITGRVHPGETVSSLIVEGVIDFLTSENQIAKILRQNIIFKIVPMLNPDGVIHGNYRTNLAGIDLNRVWDNTDKFLAPQIYQLKKYITQFNKECPIVMFCDMHGHSAQKSAFIYGCQNEKAKVLTEKQPSRLFPFMMSYVNDDFLYKSCNFNVQKNKKGTARIQLWKQLKISNIFTLEASFCSAQNSQYHFKINDYSQIGISFCKTIYQYFLNPSKKKQFTQRLRLEKDTISKKQQTQDSQSDNDLLDNKALNDLKNGLPPQQLWVKRKIQISKISTPNTYQFKQKVNGPKRRYTLDKTRKLMRTQMSPQPVSIIMAIPSKKTISSIPTKRLTLDTENLKTMEPKGYIKRSILQRGQNNYRRKSTVYRIQRKNVRTSGFDSSKKSPSIFEIDNSLELL